MKKMLWLTMLGFVYNAQADTQTQKSTVQQEGKKEEVSKSNDSLNPFCSDRLHGQGFSRKVFLKLIEMSKKNI